MTLHNHDALRRTVRDVRRRYLLRVALRGGAICLLVSLLAFLVSAYGMDHFRYSAWAIAGFRIFAYAAVLGLLVRFLLLPLMARVSDERVALYVEEHEPSLDAALVSAVESQPRVALGRADLSPELVKRLVETAIERVEKIEYGRFIERPRLNRFAALLAGVATFGMLGALLSPAFVRQAAPYLLAPWSVRAASPYAIDVAPGNVSLARGADQVVTAKLKGFDSDKVELAAKAADGQWKRQPMVLEPGSSDYRLMLLAVKETTEYFVESSSVRSAVFKLDVVDRPYVKRVDLEYVFPAYTGLAPQKLEDGGDVAALKGTEVRVRITPTVAVPSGRLLVEKDAPIPLTVAADGTLVGSFTVSHDGFYKVEMPGRDGRGQPASPDYTIQMLKDQPPSVAFVKPGRDTQVTPIEEVFTEAKAQDDFGISKLELFYSKNGGPEQAVTLQRGAGKFVSAGHTFFLEEMDLKPGDFLSYYARATDVSSPAQTATTDIYFLEARPFRRDFKQAEQGGAQGGGGQQPGALSQQQRQIIAATFKLTRPRGDKTEKELGEDIRAVALIQGRLRGQVDELVTRMASRGVTDMSQGFQDTAGELRLAISEMKAAEESLGRKATKDALPPEQKALAHLQRAEAAFREIQVAFGSEGGGSSGKDNAMAEELADLFELEMDKLRNQYEGVQRGAQQKAEEQVDEALQRLQELARRQEQENERQRQRRAPGQMNGGGGGGSQQKLAEEAEELGRKLERLAREKQQPGLEESARRLREAADAMKQSAASARNGAGASGQSALDRLNEARRLLEKNRNGRLDRDLREAQQRAAELRAAQDKIAADVRELRGGAQAEARPSGDKAERLGQRKDALESELRDFEAQLERMARDSRQEQKNASRKLQEAASGIQDSKLKEKIRYSKGLLRGGSPEMAQQIESDISGNIADLGKRLAEAAFAVGQSDDQKRAAALDKARNLVRNMESLEERLRGNKNGGGQEKGQDQQSGQQQNGQQESDGQQGQQGQGQQGQGQRGQQGGGQRASGGQQPGQPGSDRRGSTSEGGSQEIATARPGGRAAFLNGEDARQLRRELRERVGEAQDLQRELQRSGLQAQDIEGILQNMRKLDSDRQFGDPRALSQLTSQVVEDLKMLEYALRREAEGDKPKLYLSGNEELPPGYKALVEEYYRSLARKPK